MYLTNSENRNSYQICNFKSYALFPLACCSLDSSCISEIGTYFRISRDGAHVYANFFFFFFPVLRQHTYPSDSGTHFGIKSLLSSRFNSFLYISTMRINQRIRLISNRLILLFQMLGRTSTTLLKKQRKFSFTVLSISPLISACGEGDSRLASCGS